MARMDDDEFEAIVGAELTDAQTFIDDEISPQRALATDYYLGRPFGNESEGRSQMVSHDVRDTVNAIIPGLMRVFNSSEKVVEYVPTGPEDIENAAQATDYANYIYSNENDGFTQLLYVTKDSLIRKCGVMKVWWSEKECVKVENYTGLDEQTIAILEREPDTVVKITKESIQEIEQVDPATGQAFMVPFPVFDATVTKTTVDGRIKLMAVPPEEFLIDRRARSVEDAALVAHRRMMTVSDLVAMGYDYDEVMEHATDERFDQNPEYISRSQFREYESVGSAMNDAMRRVQYCEAYVKIDYDGDGVAELMKVCTLGSNWHVVNKEPCDIVPFALFPYDPEPHLSPIEAISVADLTMDIQRLKSEVWRTGLDSLAQTITPRTVVVEGQANIEDVLNNEVGAVIRVKTPGAVQELVQQNVSMAAFPMLEYIDNVKEARTGMSQASMGLDPDALQSTTKAAVAATISASTGKIEMATRILANGFKEVFRIMLHLMTTHQDKPKMIRLRNKWVSIDPRVWNKNMDVSINIALGTGTTDEKLGVLSMVAQKQEAILQMMGPSNPLVNLSQYSHTLLKMLELAGHKDGSKFFAELPEGFQLPQQQPQEDPNTRAAELLAQVEREKAQMQIQIQAAKLEADQQVQAAKLQLEREKMQADFARRQLELEMQQAKFEAELRLKEAETVLKQLTGIRGGQQASEGAMQAESSAYEAQEAQESMIAQALQAVGSLIAQSQSQTNQLLSAPKRVIRDQTGRVVGVEPDIQ